MLKLKEKLYLWIHTSKYDGEQNFILMTRRQLEDSKTDLSLWECFEIEDIPEAKKVRLVRHPSDIEYI